MKIFQKTSYSLVLCMLVLLLSLAATANNKAGTPEFYEIKIYHITSAAQEKTLDDYLQAAYLPALHKAGIGKVGVFKAIANDTATDKQVYVFIPLKSIEQWMQLPAILEKNETYKQSGKEYLDAAYNAAPFVRIESILLRAFPLATQMQMPALKAPHSERVYELRSYESATEKLYRNKVQMFNEGGEVALFKRLNFNAVFYAEVLSGSHMPNLMYMTTFENKADRDEHWKTFGADPEWLKLKALPQYQNNVSKSGIIFLRPAEYSDI
jgi:hypothetical protein